jgi:hypothetical protein
VFRGLRARLVDWAILSTSWRPSIETCVRHLHAALERLRASSAPFAVPAAEDAYAHLAGQLAAGHAVVLRSALEGLDAADREILPADPAALASFRLRLDALRTDLETRLDRVRADLPHRLGFETLGTQLLQAEWLLEAAPGLWKLPGKGTKREARAVFHVAYHALVAECERYLVQAHSRLEHLQENLAKRWHEQPLPGNRARMLPLLEEGTREAFFKRLNLWRTRMPALVEQSFCDRILPWDKLEGRTAEELFARLGAPWERAAGVGAGLCAYGNDVVDFCQILLESLLVACEKRWALFLLGEGFLQPTTREGIS